MNSHYASRNHGGYVDRVRFRSQETSHYYYYNLGERVHVERRGGYRSPTGHYSPPNQGELGRLLTFIGDTVGGDRRVGYRPQTSQYSSRRGDSRGDSEIQGIRSEEINHSSLLNFGDTVDEVGISGFRSWTSPPPSHNLGDHDRSSDFYSYGDNISWHRSHTSQFSAYNHGALIISHPRSS